VFWVGPALIAEYGGIPGDGEELTDPATMLDGDREVIDSTDRLDAAGEPSPDIVAHAWTSGGQLVIITST
jgi:hypothetical protein